MPKSTSGIGDDDLLKKLHELSPLILLPAHQVGMILSRTTGQLADDRAAGNPPPFVKVNGSIRYRVGDVRDLATRTFSSTAEASRFSEEQSAGLRFSDFTSYLSGAKLKDQWPFTIIQDKPVDFFASLTMQLEDEDHCEWLSLGDYLTRRKQSAEADASKQQLAYLKADDAVANRLKEPSAKGKAPL